MKRIAIIIVVLMTISCDQEVFVGTGLEGLREFSLTPVPSSKVSLNSVDLEGEIVFSWNAAKSGLGSDVTYVWMLDVETGDFSSPVLFLDSDISGTATKLTFTNEQLDDELAELGLAVGESFVGKWTVSATNGDVTTMAEPAVITITRVVDALASFNLSSPSDNASLDLDIDNPNDNIVISWQASFAGFGGAVTYEWQADLDGGDFSDPAIVLTSDNSGADATLTVTHGDLDQALSDLGYAQGEIANLDWRVVATSGALSLASSSSYSINLRRFDNKLDFKLILNASSSSIPGGQDVYVAGEFGNLGVTGGNWDQPGTNATLKMTYNAGSNRYELPFRVPQDKLNTTFSYKYFLATSGSPTWSYGEQHMAAGGTCVGIPSNRSVTFTTGGQIVDDEVTVWEGFCPSDPGMRFLLTVTENFPGGVDIYIAGNLGFVNWPQPGTDDRLKLKDIGSNQYEVYLPVPLDHVGEFKFFLATKTSPSWGNGEQQVNMTMDGCEGASNRGFTFTGTESIDATVDVWEGYCPLP